MLVEDPATRPDLILTDYLVDAARDICFEHNIPLAMHWLQMPTMMLPAPHIPGAPVLQIDILTSEFATVRQRLKNAVAIYTALPQLLKHAARRKKLRQSAGVTRRLPPLRKPDYLCLVNSFFGVEVPKDIPPNVSVIGPVLADEVPPLAEPFVSFLLNKRAVLYISLGTHAVLSVEKNCELLKGAVKALQERQIDGII
ncbi:hypothetical protein K4F52_006129 [Lecanicillium sp. MT-2017a]|nr:hypothetical protein K4F52_006129 [Lecanicillium sp. MT-2017a]